MSIAFVSEATGGARGIAPPGAVAGRKETPGALAVASAPGSPGSLTLAHAAIASDADTESAAGIDIGVDASGACLAGGAAAATRLPAVGGGLLVKGLTWALIIALVLLVAGAFTGYNGRRTV